jgi:hypothetical protein
LRLEDLDTGEPMELSSALGAAALSGSITATLAGAPTTLTGRGTLTIAMALLLIAMLPALSRSETGSLTGSESWLSLPVALTLRLAAVTISARFVSVALPFESTAVLPNREIGGLAFRCLSLRTGKGRANQRTMDRPFVVSASCDRFFGVGVGLGGRNNLRLLAGLECGGRKIGCVVDHFFNCRCGRHLHRRLVRLGGNECSCGGDRLLPSRCRHFGVLVLVLGVTRGAAGLLHLVFDHRDDRVICDATLARTVIV